MKEKTFELCLTMDEAIFEGLMYLFQLSSLNMMPARTWGKRWNLLSWLISSYFYWMNLSRAIAPRISSLVNMERMGLALSNQLEISSPCLNDRQKFPKCPFLREIQAQKMLLLDSSAKPICFWTLSSIDRLALWKASVCVYNSSPTLGSIRLLSSQSSQTYLS